ncbi:MAG: hypothetical protein ABJE66_18755 [Deltaproteobacteria bacterium]
MKFCFALIAALALSIGCGDNSDECGPGTHAVDGVCTPDGNGSGTTCSGGTKLDPATGSCVVDPNDCQDGTVLVGNQCVDPGHVTADVEESAEPNGLGLFGEDSNSAAGVITLKPIGQHVVVHGKIIPFEDKDGNGQTDPDVDTYVVTVTSPTLVNVSADGLHGLTAGFVSLAAVNQNDPLATWERIGANLTGDTSKRQLFLPGAGTYAIAITDSRTLILNSAVAAGAADGDPDFEYYVTLDQLAIPAPTALAVTANEATSTGTLNPGEPKFFTVPMGTGFNKVTLDDDGTNYTESVVVTNTRGATSTVKSVGDGAPSTGAPAVASTIGFVAGDTTLVVADAVVDYSTDPTNYTLTIDTTDAGALSKTGGNVTQPSNATNFTLFYYDVASTDEITGMKLHFDRPVGGVIVGENDFIFSAFTYDPNQGGFISTFTDYDGLIRHPSAGRYYFFTIDLALTGSQTGTITATSTYAPVTPVAVTEGTVTASQTPDATYHTNAFTYNAGTTDDWQQFAATGGTVTSRFYDPATGYGRLSPFGADAGCADTATDDTCVADAPVIWTPTLTGGAKGHILLDDGTRNYVVVTRPSAPFTLDFRVRPYVALAPTAGGAVLTDHGTLDTTTTLKRYLIKTAAANQLKVDVVPTAMDAVLTTLDRFENPTGTINQAAGVAAEHISTLSTGWLALTVSAVTPAAGQSFDLSATALAAVAYTKTAGTTAYADACAGGTTVTMSSLDEGMSNSTIAAPTGFKLFGIASGNFRVFSNGLLAFDGTTCADDPLNVDFGFCFFIDGDLPDASVPNAIVAPMWGDLVLSSVCTKTTGTKTVVQWEGTHYNETAAVKVQAILDGATSTVEFVYAADHDAANDGSKDTIGLESILGLSAYKVGFLDSVVTPGTSILLTPN